MPLFLILSCPSLLSSVRSSFIHRKIWPRHPSFQAKTPSPQFSLSAPLFLLLFIPSPVLVTQKKFLYSSMTTFILLFKEELYMSQPVTAEGEPDGFFGINRLPSIPACPQIFCCDFCTVSVRTLNLFFNTLLYRCD